MMKKRSFYLVLIIFLQAQISFGQMDAVHELQEVVLSDLRLYTRSHGNHIQVLKDSVLEKNAPALTSVLKFNTPLYFKENGRGMVSSVSFRGTSASQTAVVWNGINVNSQFTGQTDFNTMLTSNYDEVAVRSGGGSVVYGSGAIGGSIHLSNKFRFDRGLENKIRLEYGSFNSFFGNLESSYSSKNTSIQLGVARYSSDNDYKYYNSQKRNRNGDFENLGVTAAASHLLGDRNRINFFGNYYDGSRGFSGSIAAISNSKYEDVINRNLLEWQYIGQRYNANLSLAYLEEEYKYFENRQSDTYSFGSAETAILKYDLSYQLSPQIKLGGIVDFDHTEGKGTNTGKQQRNSASVGVLYTHELNRFNYEVSLGGELNDHYQSPLLFSLGATYEVHPAYAVVLNLSRNYRVPTFNDLFWYTDGNSDLEPENSLQAEVGQHIKFKQLQLSLTAFVIDINDLLRWTPNAAGLWKPVNTESVRNYGIEIIGDWQRTWGSHSLDLSGTYAFTKTKDEVLDKELIYVPKHKATASLGYTRGRLSGYYQALFNGQVFTSSDNNYALEAYTVSNLGIAFRLFNHDTLSIGAEVENLWNTEYQSLPSRPMPGRSYNFSLTFKF